MDPGIAGVPGNLQNFKSRNFAAERTPSYAQLPTQDQEKAKCEDCVDELSL